MCVGTSARRHSSEIFCWGCGIGGRNQAYLTLPYTRTHRRSPRNSRVARGSDCAYRGRPVVREIEAHGHQHYSSGRLRDHTTCLVSVVRCGQFSGLAVAPHVSTTDNTPPAQQYNNGSVPAHTHAVLLLVKDMPTGTSTGIIKSIGSNSLEEEALLSCSLIRLALRVGGAYHLGVTARVGEKNAEVEAVTPQLNHRLPNAISAPTPSSIGLMALFWV